MMEESHQNQSVMSKQYNEYIQTYSSSMLGGLPTCLYIYEQFLCLKGPKTKKYSITT